MNKKLYIFKKQTKDSWKSNKKWYILICLLLVLSAVGFKYGSDYHINMEKNKIMETKIHYVTPQMIQNQIERVKKESPKLSNKPKVYWEKISAEILNISPDSPTAINEKINSKLVELKAIGDVKLIKKLYDIEVNKLMWERFKEVFN